MNLHATSADLIVLVHGAFVLFVLMGGLLALRWPKILWIHSPAALWGVFAEYAGVVCPLTPLEVSLRERAGQAGYGGGFIEHYVEALLYPTGLTRKMQIAFGTFALLVNLVVYWRVFRHSARKRKV